MDADLAPRPEPDATLTQLRRMLLDSSLRVAAGVGAIGLAAAVYEKLSIGQPAVAALYVGIYVLVVFGALSARPPVPARGAVLLATLLVLAGLDLWTYGVASLGFMLLLVFVLFAGLLFGLPAGLGAQALSLAVVALAAWAYTAELVPIVYDQQNASTRLLNWLSPTLLYTVSATGALIATTLILRRLDRSEREARDLIVQLRREADEREWAQVSLQESEQRYRLLAERGSEVIWEADADGVCTFVTPSVVDVVGWRPNQVMGRPLTGIVRQIAAHSPGLAEFMSLVAGRKDAISAELRVQTASDGPRWCELRAISSIDPLTGKRRIQGSLRDISARKDLEEELLQSRKLEGLGQLAGGVAHDFNNLLTAIQGSALLLHRNGAPRPPEDQESLETILDCAQRAAGLTRQLLDFARRGQSFAVPFHLHDTVRAVTSILERTVDKRISIELSLEADDPVVVGDPNQMESALLNLGINARDAMPAGGRLQLSTADLKLPEDRRIGQGVALAGRYVVVRVRDEGQGISAENLPHIFEPFYTTKGPSEGTGLGLASVYGSVTSHDGLIDVESGTDTGTTFTLYLPRAEVAAVEVAAKRGEDPPLGKETRILVVDDEAVVLRTTGRLLRSIGHRVKLIDDPREAVEYFRASSDGIDVAILDMNMPNLSGVALFEALREIDPKLPAILLTGYSSEDLRQALEMGFSRVLSKPISLDELDAAIHEALAESVAAR